MELPDTNVGFKQISTGDLRIFNFVNIRQVSSRFELELDREQSNQKPTDGRQKNRHNGNRYITFSRLQIAHWEQKIQRWNVGIRAKQGGKQSPYGQKKHWTVIIELFDQLQQSNCFLIMSVKADQSQLPVVRSMQIESGDEVQPGYDKMKRRHESGRRHLQWPMNAG